MDSFINSLIGQTVTLRAYKGDDTPRTIKVDGVRDIRKQPLKQTSKSTIATTNRPFLLNGYKDGKPRSYWLSEDELLSLAPDGHYIEFSS